MERGAGMNVSVVLPEALHARPANLLVRMAAGLHADVVIHKGTCTGNAKNILEVLSLGAMKGDELVLEVTGPNAAEAAEAIRELILGSFNADLVPETGIAGVDGIAIGKAIVVEPREDGAGGVADTPSKEQARAAAAIATVEAELGRLVAALPRAEAELFEPEIAIVEDLRPRVLARLGGGGRAEDAVRDETVGMTTDLVLDARARLLDALMGASPAVLEATEDTILVTDALVPSLVASMPKHVVGIVAGLELDAPAGFTSHAAILARGRGIPLAFVPAHVTAGITTGELVVVDTTEAPARVWVAPGSTLLEQVRSRRSARERMLEEEAARALVSLAHLGIAVRVNVGALADAVPRAAEGIGLLRTELCFADRTTPPSESEQLAGVLELAKRAAPGPLVARLFDAGGDKPMAWLAPPELDRAARGIALLFFHGSILDTQLRALSRAAELADVRALLPLVRSEEDVHAVRKRAGSSLRVGAMIETPDAVERIGSIADAADFVCIGTNDLTAFVLGVDRAGAALTLDRRVLALVRKIVEGAHSRGKQVTVCGEVAGDERGARILVGLGVDALSVAPMRVAPIRVALGATTRATCDDEARAAER